ncbi:endo alpha-1,4 polygalactosaminidase [Hyalangium versicolor]|uniref:endo alpha-1,4 polygalactosaminidase n=1 Tax=Hyalangium versicolor TaxID=2861190 RepID=UPI001CCA21A4|nr:endo alpha-1,4 polygalactosaminidase [Hyalangium versicolor]
MTATMRWAAAGLVVGMLVACGGGDSSAPATTTTSDTSEVSRPEALSPAPLADTWWKPALTDTWQIQLTGTLNTSYNVNIYDIDLFDTSTTKIASIKAQGRRVICYFSAGSSEDWRDDFDLFTEADMGEPLDGWEGERWLDTRSTNVRSIMAARLDLAKSKGCDAVDPDNVDGYTNDTGLPLTAATQLDYNRWLATQAHARGLAVGLKNDIDQLSQLAASHDFAVNEQCHQYNECDGYTAFTSLGKPVFNIEYASKYVNNTNDARTKMCAKSATLKLSSLVLALALNDSRRITCN